MAKRKEIETSGSDTAATPGAAADKTQRRHGIAGSRVAVDFSREGGNRCRRWPPRQEPAATTRSCRYGERARRRSASGTISAHPFPPALAFPSTPQALCAACRIRGDRGGLRCRGRRCGNRRVLQSAGSRHRGNGREQGDAAIRCASHQGNHKSEGEPRSRQQSGSQPDCETQRSSEPRDGNHRLDNAAADGPRRRRQPRPCPLRVLRRLPP